MKKNYEADVSSIKSSSERIEGLWVFRGLYGEKRSYAIAGKWWCERENILLEREEFSDSIRILNAELKTKFLFRVFIANICVFLVSRETANCDVVATVLWKVQVRCKWLGSIFVIYFFCQRIDHFQESGLRETRIPLFALTRRWCSNISFVILWRDGVNLTHIDLSHTKFSCFTSSQAHHHSFYGN